MLKLFIVIFLRSSVAYILFVAILFVDVSSLFHGKTVFQSAKLSEVPISGWLVTCLIQVILLVVSSIFAYGRARHDWKLWKKARHKLEL